MDKGLLYIICEIFKFLTWYWFGFIVAVAALIVTDSADIVIIPDSKWI